QKNHPSTKINFIKFDITDKSSIKKSLDQIISESGKIDVFVNGAGVILEENIEKMIAINLTGLMNATYAVRDIMDKSKGGNGGVILN
uniref:Uncharacterized protein n=1 Tax=Megaselia scalaris TaxID=36166 RepID=T1GYD4_MEGSC